MAKSSNNTNASMEKNQTNTENGTAEKNASKAKSGKTLQELFEKNLKAIYSAEKQLVVALPEMAKAVDNEDLQDIFNGHLQETKRHVERIEKIFDRLGIEQKEEKTCKIMQTMIEEANKISTEYEQGPVRDSALVIAAQKVEYHEIAAYETLCELAEALGHTKVAEILDRTLVEEEDAQNNLCCIVQDINDEAYETQYQQEEQMA
ncbi:MAG: YciE/YciF ferroxidase family protein [Bacteroidia bacterium]